MSATVVRRPIAMRIPEQDLAEIDRQANELRLSRTEFMVRASTGGIKTSNTLKDRLDAVEQRLQRLEQVAY